MSSPFPTFSVAMPDLAAIAEGQLGVAEIPRGSNSGAAVRRYQEATNLDGTGWPWCAAFIDWCIARWLEAGPQSGDVRVIERPRTAAAFGLLAWAKGQAGRGVKVFAPGAMRPVRGDLVIYTFSHCGIVAGHVTSTAFDAVEGNTNDEGGRDGYEVARRSRTYSAVRAFIRLPQEQVFAASQKKANA